MTTNGQHAARPRPWDAFISDRDREIYAKSGFGASVGVGERPALLIIDAQYRTTGEGPVPIEEAMKQYATAVGEDAWRAVEHIEQLVKVFRAKGLARHVRAGRANRRAGRRAIHGQNPVPVRRLQPPWQPRRADRRTAHP